MASALELFVNTVRNYCSEERHRDCVEYLTKSNDLLVKNAQHLDNVLETLNIQQHSLGILAVLLAKFEVPAAQAQANRYSQAVEFINNCSGEQVRLAPDMFADLCHSITVYLVEQKQPMRGILLLKKAIGKTQMYDTQLTSIHAELCYLSLLSKCFKEALSVLDVDITGMCHEVQHGQPFDSKYYLLYYYYGGMIYLAVRNLDRALYFFEVCITTPAHAVSHIMLEAYKKYVLVALLLHGKVQVTPKYTAQVVNRFIKPLSQQYLDLGTAFMANNATELNNILTKYQEIFTRDHNMGLVRQVVLMLHKKNIQRLTKTFLTLSLSDVAARVGLTSPQDAERVILHMIEDGQIYATINQKDGMVIFRDEPEKYNGLEVLNKLEAQLIACMELDKRITKMDEDIQMNPSFIKKVMGMQEDDQPGKNTYAM